jgi:lantibiotic modifying enzyme
MANEVVVARSQRTMYDRAVTQAGARLVEVGIPDRGGVKWEMTPGNARNLPNFSHGTAGVAYYLTTLYRRTQDRRALNAALAGARYLTEAADRSDGGFRVFHADPDGLDRFYLGWCHGPPGTGRLFYQLWRATGGASWRDLYLSCARSVLTSGVPQAMNPGLWNNVGQCCGSAGIADFLLHASGVLGDNAYLAQAEALTRDLLARGVLDDRGLRFPQAEHRVKPDLVVAQTGFMQGAAGVGLWLLRLHGFATNRGTSVAFPDSPYED